MGAAIPLALFLFYELGFLEIKLSKTRLIVKIWIFHSRAFQKLNQIKNSELFDSFFCFMNNAGYDPIFLISLVNISMVIKPFFFDFVLRYNLISFVFSAAAVNPKRGAPKKAV